MSDPGLSKVSTDDLRRLLEVVEQGRIEPPLSSSQLHASNLGHIAPHIAILAGLDRKAVYTVLRAVLAERSQPKEPRVDLVWTGPDSKAGTARYTAVVVDELFEKATKHVLIGGYAFDHGEELFEPLYRVMQTRGVITDIFVDVRQMESSLNRWARLSRRDMTERLRLITQARQQGSEKYADEVIAWFLDAQWPFGEPKPNIYYDPRTADEQNIASLHAKCLVVDNQYALITSANFTDRGQTRNIEAGVLIQGSFAAELAIQWRKLIDGGLVRCRAS
ncbi:MAG: DISARM system phospholipase D-like protein DrmC [Deltaproteobacteria bacterium]|nr:DISARM system phospholipase D-like protein DrmC [Deltaproteobacteria bacterium]